MDEIVITKRVRILQNPDTEAFLFESGGIEKLAHLKTDELANLIGVVISATAPDCIIQVDEVLVKLDDDRKIVIKKQYLTVVD